MRTRFWKWALVAVVLAVATVEYVGLVRYVTGGLLDDQRTKTDMPFGTLFAYYTYLALGVSVLAGCVFFLQVGHHDADLALRLTWTGLATTLVPVSVCLTLIIAMMGPPGWLLGILASGTAPYFMVYAWLRPSKDSRGGQHR